MKIAISIPDDLGAAVDALAKHLGVSRSGLISTAVAEFLAKHESSGVTERLDEIYSREDSALDPALARAQARALRGRTTPTPTW